MPAERHDDRYGRHDDGEDGERFKVTYHCSDRCDSTPSSSATLNGIPVMNEQIVVLERSRRTEHFIRHGILVVRAPSFVLTASCQDHSGNVATVSVSPHLDDHGDTGGDHPH
jgi:hypothetical protein